MTREALLKASINEFKDNKNNAAVWELERHYTTTGYCYIVKTKSTPLSAAIHYNRSFDTNENVGKYENRDVAINTRTELPDDCIIEYKGMNIAVSSQGNYNETMGQWHYAGQVDFKAISDKFLITSIDEIDEHIGSNSLEVIMPLEFDFPLVPSYYAATSEKSYIMVDVSETQAFTPVVEDGKFVYQYKRDTVKFSFVNIGTKDALKQLAKLQEYSLMKDAEFGINNYGTLVDENFYQMSFNWKSLCYSATYDINYYLKAEDEQNTQIIREVFFENLEKI